MYKRKAQKVRPVDSSDSDKTFPGGGARWKESVIRSEVQQISKDGQGSYASLLIPKFGSIGRGSRLTDTRVAAMQIGSELWPREKRGADAGNL